MKRVALGIGSNSGDRLGHLRAAVRKLKNHFRLVAVSPIYDSKAMLPTGAPSDWNRNFLNMTVLADTLESPLDVLQSVKNIEKSMGRKNRERWAPREIDIDVLAYDNENHTVERLQIPHAGLQERPFAVLPLSDIWPDWVHPVLGLTAKQMCSAWLWSTELPFETKKVRESLTEIVAVVNLTPDSFSGDGLLVRPTNEITGFIRQQIQNGVSVVDVGAESTRPGATPLTASDEWARLEPFFKNVWPEFKGQVKLSLDSRHPANIERALSLGLDFINDVGGLADEKMKTLAQNSSQQVILMHSLTVPASRDMCLSDGRDPIDVILEWGHHKIKECLDLGIHFERIILDPGVGFGKTPAQNLHLLRQIHRFHEWKVPLLIGHSRKSLFALFTGALAAERDFETAVVSGILAQSGVEYLRVHNAALTQRAFAVQNFFARAVAERPSQRVTNENV